jgi:hypothetical protein
MTIELCRDLATARGFRYYGVQFASECYATNNGTSPFMYQHGRPCNMPCAGNVAERCGGDQANDVYDATLGELLSADVTCCNVQLYIFKWHTVINDNRQVQLSSLAHKPRHQSIASKVAMLSLT